jgi:hypothetical protein
MRGLFVPRKWCRQCKAVMHAWGESAEVYVCRSCGTCCDAEGWQTPQVVEYLERPEVLLSVGARWRLKLSELIHGGDC